jgi:dihydrofolate synthase/folylpolyglutamate synthase
MGRRFADSDEVFSFLLGFVNVEKGQKTEFKLDRMGELCGILGDPQGACPSFHIAGSKGKGSVSTMIARVLEAAGFRTGLYTSPHLLRWKERISLAGEEMPEELILAAMDEVHPLVAGKGPADFAGGELPTYFELTTLVAFCAFRLAGCERIVVETGLGGRLDSTNVLPSAASVITAIELEHTEWLGDTIPRIAFEKAGIIKPGKPCYLSRQRPEARLVFEEACAERGSPLRRSDSLVRVEDVAIDRSGTSATIGFPGHAAFAGRLGPRSTDARGLRLRTPLIGAVQAENMALAALAAVETEERVDGAALERGLASASLPARFQILAGEPPLVLDGAHTPDSVRLCLDSFEALFPGPKALLFGCAHDKHHAEMAAILAPRFERIRVTRPGDFKLSDPKAVHASFRALFPGASLVEDTKEAALAARREAVELGLPLLVTGSFYLCAEVLKLLSSKA